ncbi:LysE/ArgO family amino acid transporter [Goodfellowiella coeruleoviolacea]|uniref:LysE/ArgO family amino acid transporter n=1 Tax=Goodfellowiella coeruleoviolacea TaxID=334858 RepID=UPI0020A43369|nr:LysE/ArgO family amino acid transporter [Goodfellowiella coeruleoviolacea]
MLTPVLAGLGTGLSLIVAIGAQNAFVLRQGIRREHVLPVVAICAVSDAVLIALGVGGVGGVIQLWPGALSLVGWAGGLFLICYGLLAARRALRSTAQLDPEGSSAAGSLRVAVLTCLAFTWLNPHVYLDTVLLLGTVATGWGAARWWFAAGAVTASALWFGGLGFGARLLRGFFTRPSSWRLLDGLIAATMTALGAVLLTGATG